MALLDDNDGSRRSNQIQICLDLGAVTGVDGNDELMLVALGLGWWTRVGVEYALDFFLFQFYFADSFFFFFIYIR